MRRFVLLGAGAACLLAGGLAVAQPAPPPPPAVGITQDAPPPPPREGRGPGGPGMMRPGPGGMPMGMHPHGPPPPRGASFRLERGETTVSVRCAERESMQDCVTAASAILDKMNSVSR
jgi:hypothetical protein